MANMMGKGDLVGLLRGIKRVGKLAAKTQGARLDGLLHGTSTRETLKSVKSTAKHIVVALDQLNQQQQPQQRPRTQQRHRPAKDNQDEAVVAPNLSSPVRSKPSRTYSTSHRYSSAFQPPGERRHFSSQSTFATRAWNDFLSPSATRPWWIAADAFSFLNEERLRTPPRFSSSSSSSGKTERDGKSKSPPPLGKKKLKPPSAADISKSLKARPRLSSTAKESRVPSGRIERLANFSGLAAGLAVGGVVEVTKRAVGLSEKKTREGALSDSVVDSSVLLNPANAERIVNTLCRVRGAALKLGQLLSIADNNLLSPELQSIFDRVRDSADFMPWSQTEAQMNSQLGPNWKSSFESFDEKPFAAASIGQVHMGQLHDGTQVAVKIQYPGVAASMDSDIKNLVTVVNMTKLVPDALFLDEILRVGRKELAWEVDYHREAAAYQYFGDLLKDDPVFHVPRVIADVSGQQVLSTEFVDGVPLDQTCEIECQETRNMIGEAILRLMLTELFQWRVMQTDPNWSNFLFSASRNQIGLIDFGANRFFSTDFVDNYIHIIHSAAIGDREGIINWSREVGFLTGYESRSMMEAHAESVMILGEPFQSETPFDFGSQTTMKRVAEIVPTVLKERLRPPPEEIYSLHRKMAGVFLLCTKLRCNMSVAHLWREIWDSYEFGRPDLPEALSQYRERDPTTVV